MESFVKVIFGRLAISGICTVIVLIPPVKGAQVEHPRTPAKSSVSGPTSGETGQPESGDVKERGIRPLAPRAGTGIAAPPGTIAPPTEPTAFKCSANSKQCRCSGTTDCNYMKDLLAGSCPQHTCTGSGASRKCCCVIGGATCTP
jgi:hypothetical protein